MHKLREILHPNRWFVWTIALVFAVFLVVWGAVERYSIEQEYSYTEQELFYSIRLHRKGLGDKGVLESGNFWIRTIGNPPISIKVSKEFGTHKTPDGEHYTDPFFLEAFKVLPKQREETLEDSAVRQGIPVPMWREPILVNNNLKGFRIEIEDEGGTSLRYLFDDIKHQRIIWLEYSFWASNFPYNDVPLIRQEVDEIARSIQIEER